MSADAAAADADADAAERRLNHSIPRTYFVWGIQLPDTKLTSSLWVLAIASMSKYILFKAQRDRWANKSRFQLHVCVVQIIPQTRRNRRNQVSLFRFLKLQCRLYMNVG